MIAIKRFNCFLRFPCLDTVKLLLHCGAAVDSFDCDRNTPLHTLASTFQVYRPATSEMMTRVEEICKLFIDAGIHLDSVNVDGATAARNCSARKFYAKFPVLFIATAFFFFNFPDYLESFIKRYEINSTTLKCLASRVIAQHKISYRSSVPAHLEKFIQLHSAEKL